jgi:hypothetical protein
VAGLCAVLTAGSLAIVQAWACGEDGGAPALDPAGGPQNGSRPGTAEPSDGMPAAPAPFQHRTLAKTASETRLTRLTHTQYLHTIQDLFGLEDSLDLTFAPDALNGFGFDTSNGKVRDDCFGDSEANGCSNVTGFIDMIHDIDRWHQRKFARLLQKLDSYLEADGKTVLDNSAIMYTNEMSDGKLHSFMDLPFIFAGSAGGKLRQNLYYPLGPEGQTDTSAPHNRLLNTILNVMGIPSDWFGLPEGMGGATMQRGIYEQLLV